MDFIDEENLLLDKDVALVESIFFIENEPRDIQAVSKISKLPCDIVESALEVLKQKYRNDNCGIQLEMIAGGWMLVPKKECWDVLRDRYGKKNNAKLSKAALETLSIIAYSQPVTKAEVESIRGVSADNMIHLLLERDFIKEVGKKDVPGKPVQYGTTMEFLKYFHLNSIADLPQLDTAEEERFTLAR